MTEKLIKIVFKDGRFVAEADGSAVKPRPAGDIYIHKTPFGKSESEDEIVQRLHQEHLRHTKGADAYDCAALEFKSLPGLGVVHVALQFFKMGEKEVAPKFRYLRFRTDGTYARGVEVTPIGNVFWGEYFEPGVTARSYSREDACRNAALKELGLEGIANACRGRELELKDSEVITKATAVQFYELRR